MLNVYEFNYLGNYHPSTLQSKKCISYMLERDDTKPNVMKRNKISIRLEYSPVASYLLPRTYESESTGKTGSSVRPKAQTFVSKYQQNIWFAKRLCGHMSILCRFSAFKYFFINRRRRQWC